MDKYALLPVIANSFYYNTTMLIDSYIVYDHFRTTMAELSKYQLWWRLCMACKV